MAWSGDPRVRPRTQSSLAVTGDGATWTLFNASPDLGQQIRATPNLWPKGARHSPIGAVVLTSAEVDHAAGLLSLRERHPFRLIALEPVHAALDANPMFQALDRTVVERVIAQPGQAFTATAGVSAALVVVPGKAPLYAEGESPVVGVEEGDTAGAYVTVGGTRLAYVPGCAALRPSLLEPVREIITSASMLMTVAALSEGQALCSRCRHVRGVGSFLAPTSPLTKSAKSESIVCRDRTGVRLWPWVGRKIVKAT